MVRLFQSVLQMSISACYVIAVVMVLRFILRKCPKKYSYVLWSAVGFRLCCPYSLPSVISLFNLSFNRNGSTVVDLSEVTEIIGSSGSGSVKVGMPAVSESLDQMLIGSSGTLSPVEGDLVPFVPAEAPVPAVTQSLSIDPMAVLAVVWAIGVSILLIYSFIAYFRVKREVSLSLPVRGNIRKAEIRTPFILGFIRPVIYIPFGLEPAVENIAVSHERHHIKRGDHFVKAFAFVLLCLHWMNPLVWVAYFEMVKDMEMSCDEYVLAHYRDITKSYSMALLSFSVGRQFSLSSPLAFGECSVKERIKNAMKYKIARKSASVLAAILCIVALVSCATNGSREEMPGGSGGNADNTSYENNGSEVTALKTARDLTRNPNTDGAADANGYYAYEQQEVVGSFEDNNTFVHGNYLYIDFSTAEMHYLCNKPGCLHNSDDCTSFVLSPGLQWIFLDYSGEKIIAVDSTNPNETTDDNRQGRITVMDLSGGNRDEICRLKSNEAFSDEVFILDRSGLYTTVLIANEDTTQFRKELRRYDLVTHESTTLYNSSQDLHLVSCLDNKIIFRNWNDDPVVYWALNVDTGEVSELYTGQAGIMDHYLISASLNENDTADLQVIDLKDNSSCTIKGLPWNSSNFGRPGSFNLYDGIMIWEYADPDEKITDYFVNLETGEFWENTLRFKRYAGSDIEYPVYILCEAGDDQFLVTYDAHNYKVTYTDIEGVTKERVFSDRFSYALISKEDYYAGIPNFTLVNNFVYS